MKLGKTLCALLAALTVCTGAMTSCSDSDESSESTAQTQSAASDSAEAAQTEETKDVVAIADRLQSEIAFVDTLNELSPEMIEKLIGVSQDKYVAGKVYIGSGGATAEEIAAAKVAAMAELEEYAENAAAALESYKAEMIAAVEAYAAGTTEGATVVAVPTYVVSAIYGATSTAEIDKYVAVAEAEIDELRAARDEAKAEAEKLDQAMADIDSIISALSIAQGEGDTWTSALL